MNTLQKNLRSQIEQKKMSVHALERRAGLKPSAIQNILQGKSKRPAAELLVAIAKELGCSIDELVRPESEVDSSHKRKTTTKWLPALFKDSLEKVQLTLSQKDINLSKDEVLKIVDEVYLYSANGSSSEADSRFVEWIINKHFSLA